MMNKCIAFILLILTIPFVCVGLQLLAAVFVIAVTVYACVVSRTRENLLTQQLQCVFSGILVCAGMIALPHDAKAFMLPLSILGTILLLTHSTMRSGLLMFFRSIHLPGLGGSTVEGLACSLLFLGLAVMIYLFLGIFVVGICVIGLYLRTVYVLLDVVDEELQPEEGVQPTEMVDADVIEESPPSSWEETASKQESEKWL